MAQGKKITRKDLKRPDEFVTWTAHAVEWLNRHRQMVVGAVAAAILLLLVVGIGSAYRSAQRRDANHDLGRAFAAMRANETDGAAAEFVEVSRRWTGTDAGSLAAVLAAGMELQRDNAAAAATQAEEAVARTSSLPPYVRQQALFTWALALEQQKAWGAAAEKFAEAGAAEGPYQGLSILGEARARSQAGETDRAKQLYRKYFEQFPEGPDRDIAEQYAAG